jgi:thiol-disulfide isomerase/thioredoxin
MTRPVLLAATALLLVGVSACGSDSASPAADPSAAAPSTAASVQSPAGEPVQSPAGEPVQSPAGGFIDYADYQADPTAFTTGDVVLFFNATWCPTCQEATKNLKSAGFPDGLTVVSVDYDSNLGLRKQYGVTTQHTFVQVSPDGEQMAKFTGATTVEQIESELS